MFLKLKTKLYSLTSKKKSILIILISLVVIFLFIIFCFVLKNKKVIQTTMNEVPKVTSMNSEETKDVIYGIDIKNKYAELSGTDFAILVTTMDLLQGVEVNVSKGQYRYIIENADSNRVSVIKTADNNYRDAVLVNYNRLLKDIVVIKDISGGYIAPYGFTEKGEKKFNKYSESKSIVINDNAIFSEYPIYDGNYNEIGILYIENVNQ